MQKTTNAIANFLRYEGHALTSCFTDMGGRKIILMWKEPKRKKGMPNMTGTKVKSKKTCLLER